jgi:lipopolysaccharide transport system permease protein
MTKIIQTALSDISEAFRLRRVWMALASEDIGDQHRRTALGPLWLLINYLVFAGAFVVLFSTNAGSPNYAVYVASGLFVWLYISEVTTESVTLFIREQSFIQGTTLPLSIYVLRLTMQSLIRSGYALAGCIAIMLIAGAKITIYWLYSALGIALIVAITPAAIILFAIAGAFFPDLQFIVGNLMRIGLFLTPIIWVNTGGSGIRAAFYYWNPYTYFLEIVRVPILGEDIPWGAATICITLGLVVWALAILFLGKFRKQIAFLL